MENKNSKEYMWLIAVLSFITRVRKYEKTFKENLACKEDMCISSSNTPILADTNTLIHLKLLCLNKINK